MAWSSRIRDRAGPALELGAKFQSHPHARTSLPGNKTSAKQTCRGMGTCGVQVWGLGARWEGIRKGLATDRLGKPTGLP